MTAGKREEVTKEKEVGTSENLHKRRENVGLSTCLHYYAVIIQHARGVNQNNCADGLIFFLSSCIMLVSMQKWSILNFT